ncbi:hypothetical protein ACFFX0_01280 [Citricoccus parietis]|uniref:Uncharacterized protein n=1 Tax=Citricoccus parietis TaxID=592307 RepID=A0ABV5FUF6_9MICC
MSPMESERSDEGSDTGVLRGRSVSAAVGLTRGHRGIGALRARATGNLPVMAPRLWCSSHDKALSRALIVGCQHAFPRRASL